MNWYLVPLALLLSCLASFSWAMGKFFSKPSGDNAGMKIIRVTSVSFALVHISAILITPEASARQCLTASTLYLAALSLFYWSIRVNWQNSLSAAFSSDCPLHLVNRGPYRWVRHPFYCAYLLTWSAGFVSTGRWWLLPTIAVMAAVYLEAARREEKKFASSQFAQAYREYKKSTGQFLPKPGSWIARPRIELRG